MYSTKEAAEITGLSTTTLRYYEREKLLPQIAGNSSKYSLEQRYIMVQEHMENIKSQIANLQSALALAQSRLTFYKNLLKEPMYQKIYKLRNGKCSTTEKDYRKINRKRNKLLYITVESGNPSETLETASSWTC